MEVGEREREGESTGMGRDRSDSTASRRSSVLARIAVNRGSVGMGGGSPLVIEQEEHEGDEVDVVSSI